MAGLLDSIFPQYDGGGLLDFLKKNTAGLPTDNSNQALTSALMQSTYDGALPQIGPQPSIWDQPGTKFSPYVAPPANPFNTAPTTQLPQQSPFAGLPFAQPQAAPVLPPQAAPQQPAPQAVSPQPAPDNGPINTMNIGGYQMPQFGTVADYTPKPQLPATVANAKAQDLPDQGGQLPPALGGNTFGGNFGAAIQNFAGAGGPLQAIAGGISGLLTGQRTDPLGMQQQNLKAQYDSLVPILGRDKALLAVMNPEAGKTLLQEALTNKADWGVIGEDALGNKQYGWINKLEQTINGKPMGEGGDSGAGQSGNFSFLAPGVKQVDSSLTGNDYLKQYSPEVQSAVKDYIEGRSMPTGNPRKGFTQAVKMIAQKYGADIGVPADDAAFAERRKMRNDLGASSNNSMGGILSNGKSAFEHLKTYSDRLVDVGNVSHDFPGGGIAATVQNSVGNALAGSGQKGKIAGANDAALKYGQESTKFYAGSGGGEAERMAALKANNASSTSGEEQAGFLQTERDLMIGRLQEKEKQIRDVLGQDYLDKHPVVTKELQDTIAKIDANIAKLRGNAPQASSGLPPGWSVKVH